MNPAETHTEYMRLADLSRQAWNDAERAMAAIGRCIVMGITPLDGINKARQLDEVWSRHNAAAAAFYDAHYADEVAS